MRHRQVKSKPVKNVARPQPVSESQATKYAVAQMIQRSFNPDYDQILKRVSDAPQGERNGNPIGPVGI